MNILKKTLTPKFSALSLRPARNLTLTDSYSMVNFVQHDRVALLTLNRPKALNALCDTLMSELNTIVNICDKSPEIGALVITGSERSFAAGADLKEMVNKTYQEAYQTKMLDSWNDLTKCKIPIIAAVNGFALGIVFLYIFNLSENSNINYKFSHKINFSYKFRWWL